MHAYPARPHFLLLQAAATTCYLIQRFSRQRALSHNIPISPATFATPHHILLMLALYQ
jgi:hypothetical protein